MAWLNIVGILILFFMGSPALRALKDYEAQRNAGVTTYTFDPAAAGTGTHTITYTFSDGNGCSDFEKDTIEVFGTPAPPTGEDLLIACQDDLGIADYDYAYDGERWSGSYKPDLDYPWPYISLGRADGSWHQ